MPEPSGPSQLTVAISLQRDRTITALCDHFANDRLSVDEFEQRLDTANRALTVPDLSALLADLPTAEAPAAVAPAMARPVLPGAHTRDHQTLVAIMGGVEKRGRWLPAKNTTVITVMGGGLLDFREVLLPPGETEVTILCMMGGVEIILPPGMNVDTGGFALMGAFAHRNDPPPVSDPNAPVLRINGFALMGGVDLQVRLPGETPSDARYREKEQRRRLKEQRRRG